MYDTISVNTDFPIAFDSPDHLLPWGTARDNSTNLRFNQKLTRLFSALNRPLRVLDLGCSGGGFVSSLLNQGHLAVGIEGSDYSKRHARAEWPTLGDKFLFTADITRDFLVQGTKDGRTEPVLFDVITAWEVMEHLPSDRLETVMNNIKKHLAPGGLIILSISPNEEVIRGVKLHLTAQNEQWWERFFKSCSLTHIPRIHAYFNTQFVRGPKQNAPDTFHFVLSANPTSLPRAPKIRWKEWLFDRWLFSNPQKKLKEWFVGP